MKAILLFMIISGIALADEAGVKISKAAPPNNQLDKLSLFGVKMGEFYDVDNNDLESKLSSPISEVKVLCDDEKKAFSVNAYFDSENMTKLNSWLKNFIDVVGRPTEFKCASEDGFIWMKFTEDNVFLMKDLNLISIYFGREFKFTGDNFVEMRWIKKVGNKIHFFEYGDNTTSHIQLRWNIFDESKLRYKNNFDPMDIPKLK